MGWDCQCQTGEFGNLRPTRIGKSEEACALIERFARSVVAGGAYYCVVTPLSAEDKFGVSARDEQRKRREFDWDEGIFGCGSD